MREETLNKMKNPEFAAEYAKAIARLSAEWGRAKTVAEWNEDGDFFVPLKPDDVLFERREFKPEDLEAEIEEWAAELAEKTLAVKEIDPDGLSREAGPFFNEKFRAWLEELRRPKTKPVKVTLTFEVPEGTDADALAAKAARAALTAAEKFGGSLAEAKAEAPGAAEAAEAPERKEPSLKAARGPKLKGAEFGRRGGNSAEPEAEPENGTAGAAPARGAGKAGGSFQAAFGTREVNLDEVKAALEAVLAAGRSAKAADDGEPFPLFRFRF